MDKVEAYLKSIGVDIRLYMPRLIAAVLVFTIGLWVINRIIKLINSTMHRKGLHNSLQSFLTSLASVGLKLFLAMIAAGILGIQTTSFVALLGAAGLAVGLALQGSLSNFAGGVLTLIFKPYVVGDTIEAQGQTGTVLEIQIFNTILLTGDNKTAILPNGAVSNGTIVNQTRHGNLRIEILVTVASDSDVTRVREIIMDILTTHPLVLKDPVPSVNVTKITGGVTLAIHPYCLPTDTDLVSTQVQERLKLAFENNGIKAPVPQSISINKNGDAP